KDGRIDAEVVDRLDGDLRRELGSLAKPEEGGASADLHVLRQVTPRLPHEPNRRGIHLLAAAGFQETVLSQGRPRLLAPPRFTSFRVGSARRLLPPSRPTPARTNSAPVRPRPDAPRPPPTREKAPKQAIPAGAAPTLTPAACRPRAARCRRPPQAPS